MLPLDLSKNVSMMRYDGIYHGVLMMEKSNDEISSSFKLDIEEDVGRFAPYNGYFLES